MDCVKWMHIIRKILRYERTSLIQTKYDRTRFRNWATFTDQFGGIRNIQPVDANGIGQNRLAKNL